MAKRLSRLLIHLLSLFSRQEQRWLPWRGIGYWIGDMVFLILDVVFIAELHYLLMWMIGKRGRKLTKAEVALARQYFADKIDLTKVRMQDGLGKRFSKRVHAYVTFDTINFRKSLSDAVFIHELVHVWQYQRYGSPYIFRALLAQMSEMGYDYGGVESLYAGMLSGKRFIDYNFEQQGDIFQDAYTADYAPNMFDNGMIRSVYKYYVDQVRDPMT